MSSGAEPVRTDVVVVGAGAAGCAAAIAARRAGAQVMLLDKENEQRAGGNTRIAGGVWFGHDDVDGASVYLRSLAGSVSVDDAVARVWAEETGRNSEWITSLGGEVRTLDMHRDPEYPRLPGSSAYGGFRGVDGAWGGGVLHAFLIRTAVEHGVEVRYESPVEALLTDGEAVGGVEVGGPRPITIRAEHGVVIATGGFQNDPELVREHLGLEGAVPWGTPAAKGDGHRLTASVGAGMGPMGNHMPMMGLKAPTFEAGFPIHLPAGAGQIFVDETARRFTDETRRNTHGHVDLGDRYAFALDRPTWMIFDARGISGGPISQPDDVAPFGWNNQMGAHRWSHDNEQEIEAGWIRRAETVADLAEQLGLDPVALEESIESYNEVCRTGVDPHGRPSASLVPLDRPPFHGFAWGPLIAFTAGGPLRNEHAEVLDRDGRPIPGLYAAGEVSATYAACIDGGMMIADALAFGRVAGQRAAARRQSRKSARTDPSPDSTAS